jgi:hypothetical protein
VGNGCKTGMCVCSLRHFVKSFIVFYYKKGLKIFCILFKKFWFDCFPGKDPLPDKVDGKDINSVAGVLKLYFRELREPLFPTHLFDELIECSSNCNFNSQFIILIILTIIIHIYYTA